MSNVADFIKETCSTIGVGDLVLSGAYDASVGRFSSAWNASTVVYYSLIDGVNRESGKGTFNGSSRISRDTIYSTVLNGAYNDTDPEPLDLQGVSIVACSLNADAFEQIETDVSNMLGQVSINTANIDDNTQNITINTANIATNTTDIADNKTHIETIESDAAILYRDVNYRESAVTALETGGAIQSNGTTSILVSAGGGEIIDSYTDTESQECKEVDWPEQTFDLLTNEGMPAITGVGYTEIGVIKTSDGDGIGTIKAYPNGMSSQERKIAIRLGSVDYLDRVINDVQVMPIVSNQIGNLVLDMFDFVITANKVQGLLLHPTTIGDMTMWRDSGVVFTPGINYSPTTLDNQNLKVIPADGDIDAGIDFIPVAYNAGSTVTHTETDQVTTLEYEPDGAGVVETITNNHAVIHYMLQSLSGSFFLSYAQKEYIDYDTAVTNLYADRANHLFPEEASTFLILAQVVVLKSTATWGLTAEIYPLGTSVASGIAAGASSQAINVMYTDTYSLGSNVQSAVDTLGSIKLSPDQHAAINAANAPSAANEFATVLDIAGLDVTTKADKIVPATTNNIAVLDASGNLSDGGVLTSELDTTVVNSLSSTSTTDALSAAQGKILNDSKLGSSDKAADSNLLDGYDSSEFAMFPTGTSMIFYQAAAPTGWTQDTTKNDFMLRTVSTAGGGSGGTSSPVTSHTHTISGHSHTVDSHTHTSASHTHSLNSHQHSTSSFALSINHIPAHTHSFQAPATGSMTNVTYAAGQFVTKQVVNTDTSGTTGSTGGTNAHNHGNTGPSTSNTSSTTPGATGGVALTTNLTSMTSDQAFTPKYINTIIASKN